MIEDIDIWRGAKLLIDRHGDEAPVQAAMRADELRAAGDIEGHQIWMRLLRAIEEILRRRGDDPLN